jgi:DDE domain
MRSLGHLHPQLAPPSAFRIPLPAEVISLAGSVVPTVRPLLQRCRRAPRRARHRGRPRDHLPVGSAVRTRVCGGGSGSTARRGDRWHVDETYLRVGGTWRYLFRAIDQFGQVIDVFLSPRRDAQAARGLLRASDRSNRDLRSRGHDRPLPRLPPSPRRVRASGLPWHEVHANNPIETEHGRLKARLRPMRG